MDHLLIKTIHVTAVAISGTGFFARGLGGLLGAPWVRGRLARTLPHIVDTVLLLSALALAWTLRLTPANTPWLMAKIIGLVVYIGLGMLALRPRRPLAVRTFAWIVALATFGWIVSVAIKKSPLGILALLK
ncbi:MAG TPA: SirB2 family protein [Burkholderiaceae bacterium]|nr:SirB2 family protein [Burkholderiaceae bacterium]